MRADDDHICEEKVFERLFFEHARNLRNFLYYRCGDEALAADLVQEAYLRLWRNCARVRYPKAKAFLFQVANRLFLDEVKHRKVVERFYLQRPEMDNATDPGFLLEEEEFRKQLESAITRLPEGQRVVFLLNRVDKLTYQEIAELVGISVKAVEKRMQKALQQLRQLHEKI